MVHNHFKSCIDACNRSAAICEACATECLKEDDIKLLSLCISLTRECAIVCDAAARLMSMGGEHATMLCQASAEICHRCAEECERNAELEHCSECANECRRCADECRSMVAEHA